MLRFTALFILTISGAAWSQEPAKECLASFSHQLKDPASGRVISFNKGELVYTATNSYGGRVQARALCTSVSGRWRRDLQGEQLMILTATADKLKRYNDCRAAKRTHDACAGGSPVLRSARRTAVDTDALEREVAADLGFE